MDRSYAGRDGTINIRNRVFDDSRLKEDLISSVDSDNPAVKRNLDGSAPVQRRINTRQQSKSQFQRPIVCRDSGPQNVVLPYILVYVMAYFDQYRGLADQEWELVSAEYCLEDHKGIIEQNAIVK